MGCDREVSDHAERPWPAWSLDMQAHWAAYNLELLHSDAQHPRAPSIQVQYLFSGLEEALEKRVVWGVLSTSLVTRYNVN